ncbi:MAG: hypothetical protein V4808_03290 [Pseudomonadota bacterium]
MRFLLAAAMLALSIPAMASAQAGRAAPAADCGDDNGVDRCDAAQQAKTRALFGAATIDQMQADGAQVLRAFFVNGYGRDEAHVAFVRPKGGDAEVIVTLPALDAAKGSAMRAAVSLAIWDRLFARARYFDRDLVPLPADKDEIVMCLHSWVATVEAASEKQGAHGGARRKTQDACGGGLAMDLAFEMADAAVELMPACALLNAEQHRNAVTRLDACAQLSGDRAAAALAMNQYNRRGFSNPQPGMTMPISFLFYDRAEIDWPGELTVRGNSEATAAWVDRMQKRHFWVRRAIGETPDRVRIEGVLQDWGAGDSSRQSRADAVMIWTRENGFDFRMRSLKVSAFKPLPE